MTHAEDVSNRLARLYGADPASAVGVLHVVATWRAPDTTLRVIRIGPGSPASETDGFVLRTARMRADALLTTGKILRDEPDVRHAEDDPALLAWRRERIGRTGAPRSVVLSSGHGLDLAHPLLRSAHQPLVVTSTEGAAALESAASAAETRVQIAAREAPGIRDAIALLRELGCRTILIEAGPTTAAALYDEPVLVDELLLSVYEAPALADALVGPAFIAAQRLEEAFARRSEPTRIEEPSGPWSFSRWLRR
jgi:riboflavin biosynthesis pyrimidine reductase